MKKKFAFFVMGAHYVPERDRAVFETKRGCTLIYSVNDLDGAIALAKTCAADGVGAIELCGAFGESGAKAIIDATNGEVAVGFVVHLPEQDAVFAQFFS